MEPLTKREAQVAELIVAGYSRKGIARKLGIQIQTVDSHMKNAAGKLPGTGGPRLKLVLFVVERLKRIPEERSA